MDIRDINGKQLDEVTLRLTATEVTELLVAASELDEGSKRHTLIRDRDGSTFALYIDATEDQPLKKGTDWWVGPILLLGIILMVVGMVTIARGAVTLLFR